VLLQPGQDPHGFAPSAQQVAALRTADLVVANGLGLEEGLLDVLAEAGGDGVEVLELAPALDPVTRDGQQDDPDGHESAAGDDPHAEDDHGEEGHGADPHVWLDPVRVADAVGLLAERLAHVDSRLDDEVWRERGRRLSALILDVHLSVERTLADVPMPCRVLVTNHDSLGYMADRYGFTVLGTVIPGTSTNAQPSARDFAALVQIIREAGVTAIFAETSESTRLAETLAQEVGEIEVIQLHTGSLGEPGSGAETYEGMLTSNARRMAEALSSCAAAAG
ncbi:MAG: metal ABC transporter substrate-binding protein, partial [Nitriliruptorales bacterium]|nr:metal ABC transporter substrate-binding protein [Nitriliruptorales bacterium]